jgi:DNA-binding CsgD family transcriptional regulator
MYRNASDDICIKLSKRECETLRLLIQGETQAQIANRLGISRRMVNRHIESLRKKTNTKSTIAAVAYAIRRGLI